MAVIVFNRGISTVRATFSLSEIGFSSDRAKIRDLVLKKDLGTFYKEWSVLVKPHSV